MPACGGGNPISGCIHQSQMNGGIWPRKIWPPPRPPNIGQNFGLGNLTFVFFAFLGARFDRFSRRRQLLHNLQQLNLV